MIVLTGGSSVKNGYWNKIDNPTENDAGFWVESVREISKKVNDFLIATGKVGRTFSYLKSDEILIIQTSKWDGEPQQHIFMASLMKLLGDCPGEEFVIPTPFTKEETIAIRRRIAKMIPSAKDRLSFTLQK